MICPDCGTETSLDVCLCGAVLKDSNPKQQQEKTCVKCRLRPVHGPKFKICLDCMGKMEYEAEFHPDPSAEQIEKVKETIKKRVPYES